MPKRKVTKFIFPTDEHVPYIDKRAVALAMKIAADFKPDLRISGSDGVDFYSLSSFDKNPARIKVGLQSEIDQWVENQRAWLSATPNADVVWIPGNHEDRMRRWLWKHPEVYELRAMKYENLFRFDELGIVTPENSDLLAGYSKTFVNLYDRLLIKHGTIVRGGSGGSALAELGNEKFAISTITGHTHRGGSVYVTTRRGVIQAHEGFCLCRTDPEYIDVPDWQQGIVLGEVSDDFLHVDAIPFFRNGKKLYARWRGKEYVE